VRVFDDVPAELAQRLHAEFADKLTQISYGRSSLHDVFLSLTETEGATAAMPVSASPAAA
jgi:hypothetical protein